jgi:hypothetical protein
MGSRARGSNRRSRRLILFDDRDDATLFTEVGESIKTTQAILGHSDLDTTHNISAQPIPESQRRAVERVAEILDPNGLRSADSSAAQVLN